METSPVKLKKSRSRLKSASSVENFPAASLSTSTEDSTAVNATLQQQVNNNMNGEKGLEDESTTNISIAAIEGVAATNKSGSAEVIDDGASNASKAESKADSVRQQGVKRKLEDDSIPHEMASKGADDSETPERSDISTASKNDDESKDDSTMLDNSSELGSKQLFGKGKRARIPNKRYSDFPLKAGRGGLDAMDVDSASKSYENGDAAKENIDHESPGSENTTATGDASENSSSTFNSPSMMAAAPVLKGSAARLSQVNSPATPAAKKPKISVDLANPNYMKPFKFGWKRELVYRAANDNSIKRNSDVYYYTPSGRKVRSMREVSENLKSKELTLDDFTFFKEPLGLDDPEKEIIRDAKLKSVTSTPASATKKTIPKPKVAKASAASKLATAESEESKVTKNSPRLGGFKIKLPSSNKSKGEKKVKAENMEIDSIPQNWTPGSNKKKASKPGSKTSSPKKSKRLSSLSSMAVNTVDKDKPMESKFMESYFQNVAFGYSTLLHVFQYLKVQDLLRAGCVCSMWHDIANHSMLWKTVRMKNSQIHSFKGLADALQKHGTVHLDLRKMLLPSNSQDDIWQEFSKEIKKVESLRKIELCRCPAVVVEQLALSNPKLEVINAVTIKCESMNIAQMAFYNNLQELRLKSTAGFSLTSDLTALSELTQLKHLSLTSVRDLNKLNIEVIAELKNLESLDLGECADFPNTFGSEILQKLEKLEKLRLEKGQGNCYTFEILDAVKNMPHLEQLELVNFDIKTGFDRALGACTNIKKLLIIPTYISQSATTNHMVLGGVLRLQSTLSHFVWGVTLELLRVTELFVDQCEDPDKKEKKERRPTGNGDSIPVLKPVPLLKDGTNLEIPPAQDPPQVEILPLPTLQKLLLQSLPTTRVKILKIPFHATWRQFITDTVN